MGNKENKNEIGQYKEELELFRKKLELTNKELELAKEKGDSKEISRLKEGLDKAKKEYETVRVKLNLKIVSFDGDIPRDHALKAAANGSIGAACTGTAAMIGFNIARTALVSTGVGAAIGIGLTIIYYAYFDD